MRELDHLIVDKRVTALRIIDAIFTSDLERAKDIARHLSSLKEGRGVRLPWIYWEFDYNSVDEEFLEIVASLKYREKILNSGELTPRDSPQLYSEMLKDYTVVNSIGIESFCDRALRAVGRRRMNREKFDAFMRAVNKHNVVLKMDVILGLPFDTLETFFDGLGSLLPYLKGTDHILNIHRLQILPGSELEELSEGYGMEYSQSAPHIVYSTSSITRDDMDLGSKLSALLSRMVNSPMRGLFFDSWERSGEGIFAMLKKLFEEMQRSGGLAATQLARDEALYDNYWNDAVYREIPSKYVGELLQNRI